MHMTEIPRKNQIKLRLAELVDADSNPRKPEIFNGHGRTFGLALLVLVEAELAYHTQYDTVDVIDSGALDLTANAVVGVVRQLDLGR